MDILTHLFHTTLLLFHFIMRIIASLFIHILVLSCAAISVKAQSAYSVLGIDMSTPNSTVVVFAIGVGLALGLGLLILLAYKLVQRYLRRNIYHSRVQSGVNLSMSGTQESQWNVHDNTHDEGVRVTTSTGWTDDQKKMKKKQDGKAALNKDVSKTNLVNNMASAAGSVPDMISYRFQPAGTPGINVMADQTQGSVSNLNGGSYEVRVVPDPMSNVETLQNSNITASTTGISPKSPSTADGAGTEIVELGMSALRFPISSDSQQSSTQVESVQYITGLETNLNPHSAPSTNQFVPPENVTRNDTSSVISYLAGRIAPNDVIMQRSMSQVTTKVNSNPVSYYTASDAATSSGKP